MTRRGLTNLALLLAIGAAGLVIALQARNGQDTARAWIDRPAATVQRIRASRAGALQLEMKREAGGWTLVYPYQRAARAERVRHLLGLLEQNPLDRYSAEEVDLVGAGLESAEWQIDFDGSRVRFGARAAVGERRYARHRDRVVLLDDIWQPLLAGGAGAFADLSLSPFGDRLAEIETPLVQVSRDRDGWNHRGQSSAAARRLAAAWREGQALRIDTLVEGISIGTIKLTADDGRQLSYRLLETTTGLALQVPESSYQLLIDSEQADRLLQIEHASPENDA